MTSTLCSVYFLPPMAIARVGGSATPVDSFVWEEDPDAHNGAQTVIRPRPSLQVLADGTPRVHLPRAIVFRDDGELRPVAPFFELWAELHGEDGERYHAPVTPTLLGQLGVSVDAIRITARAGNFKASRRTHDPACAFIGELTIKGDDHTRHSLDAFSPPVPHREPLVYENNPICLGHVQLLRPVEEEHDGVNLGAYRVRFTPAGGQVFGPVGLASAAASPLEPGRALATESTAATVHEVVPPANRILNPNTPWSRHVMDTGRHDDPQPADSYDGANVDGSVSWGVVDDTCEAAIKLELVVDGERYAATARALVAQPDYAPDRRPVYSYSDELADRELPRHGVSRATVGEALSETSDLFARAFENLSLLNLDAARDYLVRENLKRTGGEPAPEAPSTGFDGMSAADRPLSRVSAHVQRAGPPDSRTPLTDVARQVHAALVHAPQLLHVLRTQPDRFRKLLRPPFARFSQLSPRAADDVDGSTRDPRRFRDTLHDMRMPPYMRDSGREPLSISSRQYDALMDLIDWLEENPAAVVEIPQERPQGRGIYPRNLTARLEYMADGNPVTSRLEDAVGNCFPGLEVDVRNLDRRFFPGLVFNFASREHRNLPAEDPEVYGALLVSLEYESDPDLPPRDPDAIPLLAAYHGPIGRALSKGEWFLRSVTQEAHTIDMVEVDAGGERAPLDGMTVWRIVRGLDPGPVSICLERRDAAADPIVLHGWRRIYVDPTTGVINDVFQPGEMVQSLCSPWQHDFRDCACMYWASNRPDVVFGEAKDEARAGIRMDWLRADRSAAGRAFTGGSYYDNRPHQMNPHELNARWPELSVVLEQREIGDVYRPPATEREAPYDSPEELARVLRVELAPLELALSLEYLYAHFSIRSADEVDARRLPRLADEAALLRRQLLMIAISEMSHLRWVNQILAGLRDHGLVPGYEPVVTPAAVLPRSRSGPRGEMKRPFQLRPCTPEALADFIDIEQPSGFIDGAYARAVATLRQPEYPPDLYQLAVRIDSDGADHYRAFCRSAASLRRYSKTDSGWPYLRTIRLGERRECEEALDLYEQILESVRAGFQTAAATDFEGASEHQLCSRDRMERLQEAAARRGVGVCFTEVTTCE